MTYTLTKSDHSKNCTVNGLVLNIPNEWTVSSLGKDNKFISGGTPDTKNQSFWNGGLPWMTPVEVGKQPTPYIFKSKKTLTAEGARKLFSKKLTFNDLIITTRGTVGNLALAGSDMYFNQSCEAIRVIKNNSLYVYYYLKQHRANLLEGNSSTVFKSLTKKDLQKIEIVYPELSEQTAIANILSDQETLIAHCNDLIALHEKRFAYLSDELLSGRLRLEDNSAGGVQIVMNDEWQEVDVNGKMVSVPVGWAIKKLTTYANINSGQSPESSLVGTQGLDFHQGNSLFGDKYIQLSSRKITLANATKIAKAGELLFSVRAPVGEVNFTQTDICIGRGLAAFSTTQSISFLYYALQYHKTDFKKLSTGTTFEGISAKNIGLFELEVPPILEQTAIANVLSDQEALIAQYKTLRDAEKKRFDWLSDALLLGTYRVKVEE